MKKIKIFLLLFVVFAVAPLFCSIKSEAAMRLNRSKITLKKGKSFQLKVYGTKKKCKWTSTNKKVAKVSSKGKVTARKVGTATIKAKIGRKVKKCKAIVKAETKKRSNAFSFKYEETDDDMEDEDNTSSSKTKYSLSENKVDIVVGSGHYIEISGASFLDEIECSSKNQRIVTVERYDYSSSIYVKGISEGTTTVTVKIGSWTASCVVTVHKDVKISNSDLRLTYHGSQKIEMNVDPSLVQFVSKNEKIATVDSSGVVYGKGIGSTQVEITYLGRKYCVYVYVQMQQSEFIYNNSLRIHVGQVGVFSATCTNKDIMTDFAATIYSSNEDICTVDSDGNIYAKSVGTTSVVINVEKYISLNCYVTVYDFQIPKEEGIHRKGDSEYINCKGIYGDQYQVTSSNENVVAVRKNGSTYEMKVLGSGTATLTYTCGDYSATRKISVALGVVDAIKQRNYQGYNDNERQTLQAVRWVIDRTTSSGMSTSQKVKAIHDYLVLNCDYDYYALNNGTISNESYGYYGVFRNGKAVCNGYAQAFMLCMKVLDIPCKYITGGTTNGGHAWNQVYVDGTWYYIDVTWDDPIINGGIDPNYIRWTYYLSASLWSDHSVSYASDNLDFDEWLNPNKINIIK